MFTVRKLHPLFGAELTGVKLEQQCTPAIGAEVRATLHEHGVLALPDQHLSDAGMERFARSMGTIYQPQQNKNVGSSYVSAAVFGLSNMDKDGNITPADDRMRAISVSNELWHTDHTYTRPRAELSMLGAQIVPPAGGETEFCDTRIAYEALSDARKAELEPLFAHHSALHSRALTGFTDWKPEERAMFPPVRRSLVNLHNETGRKALYLASHIELIEGYTPAQSQSLVNELIAWAATSERVYTHRWKVGDLLIWDNRATMHRARPFEDMKHRRSMRSCRVLDPAELTN